MTGAPITVEGLRAGVAALKAQSEAMRRNPRAFYPPVSREVAEFWGDVQERGLEAALAGLPSLLPPLLVSEAFPPGEVLLVDRQLAASLEEPPALEVREDEGGGVGVLLVARRIPGRVLGRVINVGPTGGLCGGNTDGR